MFSVDVVALLFNLPLTTLPPKYPQTLRSAIFTYATNPHQHVSGVAYGPEHANQCQDFDDRSRLCREEQSALALYRSAVASGTRGCSNSRGRYIGKYQMRVKAIVRDSFDYQSYKLDVKGKRVNLTIWVRFFGDVLLVLTAYEYLGG